MENGGEASIGGHYNNYGLDEHLQPIESQRVEIYERTTENQKIPEFSFTVTGDEALPSSSASGSPQACVGAHYKKRTALNSGRSNPYPTGFLRRTSRQIPEEAHGDNTKPDDANYQSSSTLQIPVLQESNGYPETRPNSSSFSRSSPTKQQISHIPYLTPGLNESGSSGQSQSIPLIQHASGTSGHASHWETGNPSSSTQRIHIDFEDVVEMLRQLVSRDIGHFFFNSAAGNSLSANVASSEHLREESTSGSNDESYIYVKFMEAVTRTASTINDLIYGYTTDESMAINLTSEFPTLIPLLRNLSENLLDVRGSAYSAHLLSNVHEKFFSVNLKKIKIEIERLWLIMNKGLADTDLLHKQNVYSQVREAISELVKEIVPALLKIRKEYEAVKAINTV